jgi:hypothetical protein
MRRRRRVCGSIFPVKSATLFLKFTGGAKKESSARVSVIFPDLGGLANFASQSIFTGH